MIITNNDLYEFEQQYEKYLNDQNDLEEGNIGFSKWLLQNPYIVLVANFTDYTPVNEFDLSLKLIEDNWFNYHQPLYRDFSGRWLFPWSFGDDNDDKWEWINLDAFNIYYEKEEIDNKYDSNIDDIDTYHIKNYLKGAKDPYVHNYLKAFSNEYLERIVEFREKIENERDYVKVITNKKESILTFDEIYCKLKKCLKNPFSEKRILLSKNWYKPKCREKECMRLKDVTHALLSDLQESKLELNDIGNH